MHWTISTLLQTTSLLVIRTNISLPIQKIPLSTFIGFIGSINAKSYRLSSYKIPRTLAIPNKSTSPHQTTLRSVAPARRGSKIKGSHTSTKTLLLSISATLLPKQEYFPHPKHKSTTPSILFRFSSPASSHLSGWKLSASPPKILFDLITPEKLCAICVPPGTG